MAESRISRCWKLGIASFLAISGAIPSLENCALAQLIPDHTLEAESSEVIPKIFINELPSKGSEFVVTGRGGLPPTPTEAIRSDTVLADLGSPVQNQENSTSAAIPKNTTSSEPGTLVEAQGWVIGSKGEVILTASAPIATLDVPWLTPTSCHG